MRFLFTAIVVLVLSACATALTERGRSVTVINSMSAELANDCKRVGTVTGYAQPGWGNDVGLEQALNDAKNKAGEIAGADTLAISLAQRKFSGGEVSGVVFNCSEKRVHLIQSVSPAPEVSGNVFERAKKCQGRGGVWVNDQCVINLD